MNPVLAQLVALDEVNMLDGVILLLVCLVVGTAILA